MERLGIVADDLTGAMDTGVQFGKMGLATIILLDERKSIEAEADVVVINTESRSDRPLVAYEKVRSAAKRLEGMTIYKKIDSTLRGNVGYELEAIMDQLGVEKALVAPAFPENGRTTVEGCQLVYGIPLAETQFAHDPISPVQESHIPTLLQHQAKRAVGGIGLATVSQGTMVLAQELMAREENILVVDAVDKEHLSFIAQAFALVADRCLACGSAGLASQLPSALSCRKGEAVSLGEPASGPVLVVAGSRNSVTAKQIKKAREALSPALVEPSPAQLADEARATAYRWSLAVRVRRRCRC